MHPPYSNWLERIVSLIVYRAKHNRSYDEIISVAKNYGPQHGWYEDTKTFAKLATKIALKTDK